MAEWADYPDLDDFAFKSVLPPPRSVRQREIVGSWIHHPEAEPKGGSLNLVKIRNSCRTFSSSRGTVRGDDLAWIVECRHVLEGVTSELVDVDQAPLVLDFNQPNEIVADEGTLLARWHYTRERDRKLRSKKIAAVRKAGAALSCEVCQFDFEVAYGPHGADFIECHHRRPLADSGPTKTSLSDLALLCSNCHRMIHYRSPWLSVEELHQKRATAGM
ncbi:HNH endonuclease [Cryptosporangium sp. NPDC051539]|uniref:HNH endonuclease n=1 Tax=Cryptosporangium sp. NPDC051539 TaxID=3363962 RepID=UPI0037A6A41B